MKVLLVLLTISSVFAKDIVKSSNRSIASMKVTIRKEQAKELLGKRYNTSTVADFENRAAIETYIYDILPKYLPKKIERIHALLLRPLLMSPSEMNWIHFLSWLSLKVKVVLTQRLKVLLGRLA
jgi:hypothetical protein